MLCYRCLSVLCITRRGNVLPKIKSRPAASDKVSGHVLNKFLQICGSKCHIPLYYIMLIWRKQAGLGSTGVCEDIKGSEATGDPGLGNTEILFTVSEKMRVSDTWFSV